MKAGETVAFVFAIDAREQAIPTLRFTDDAGLRWQIDNDMHLEQHAERDDW